MFLKIKRNKEKNNGFLSAKEILEDFRYIYTNNIKKDANFYNYYPKIDLVKPLVCTSQLCNQEFFGLPLFQYWSNKIINYWRLYDFIKQQGGVL